MVKPIQTFSLFSALGMLLLSSCKEQHDLSSEYPELTESLKQKSEAWWEEVTRGTALDTVPVLEYRQMF